MQHDKPEISGNDVADEIEAENHQAEQLAEKFHNLYEQLAPEHGYETRKESAVAWENVPAKNKGLMIDVCRHLLATCQELSIEELTARLYEVKTERDKLLLNRVAIHEELAQKFRASLANEVDGTRESLERCAKMLETYAPDLYPANDKGQVHFARAMMESVADEIKAFLSK